MIGFDLIVVGGGPAGLAAGIQAAHMGLSVKILEKIRWGGRLLLARRVDNVPGLMRPHTGRQAADKILRHARRKGLSLAIESCKSIGCCGRRFVVHTDGDGYFAKAVVIACGVEPDRIIIPGLGSDADCVFYSWPELYHPNGKRVGVIGGGEAAFDQACSLAEKGADVTVFVRGPRPRAFGGLVEEAWALGVRVMTGAEIVYAEKKGRTVTLYFRDPAVGPRGVNYILAAVGASPAEVKLSGLAADRAGKGLFWAGDVCSGRYRQAAVATGEGIKAGMMVYEYLRGE